MVFRKYKKDRRKRKSEKTNTDERTTTPPAVRFLFVCFSRVSLSLTKSVCLSFFERKGDHIALACWCTIQTV